MPFPRAERGWEEASAHLSPRVACTCSVGCALGRRVTATARAFTRGLHKSPLSIPWLGSQPPGTHTGARLCSHHERPGGRVPGILTARQRPQPERQQPSSLGGLSLMII